MVLEYQRRRHMATSTSAALSGHPLHVASKSKTAEIIPIAAAGGGGPFEPTKSNQRILALKIRHCGVRRHNKIAHPDQPETTEGHHGEHYTDDILLAGARPGCSRLEEKAMSGKGFVVPPGGGSVLSM